MTESNRSATLRYDEAPIPDPAAGVRDGGSSSARVQSRQAESSSAERSTLQWHALYERALHAPASVSHRAPLSEAAQQAQREYEQWCRLVVRQVMADLERMAAARATEFESQTGHRVAVVATHASEPEPDGDPQMRFMRLALGASQVHIYSSCCTGSTPQLHLLPSRRDSVPLNQRLVSKPGAFVERRADGGYQLRTQRRGATRPGVRDEPTSLDAVLLRAFELLVSIELDHQPLAGD